MRKLWVDDTRSAPNSEWLVARTYQDAYIILMFNSGKLDEASFDHDLGSEHPNHTGYVLLCDIEEMVATGDYIPPTTMRVHSANPVGRDRMLVVIDRIYRLVEERKVGA